MKQTKRWWMPVLLGCLLMAILVGVAGARPNARPLASPANTYGISQYQCIPLRDTVDWEYSGSDLQCNTGTCYFYCVLDPPHKGKYSLEKVLMYAYDNGTGDVCMELRLYKPNKAQYAIKVNDTCTSDSADNPQVVSLNPADFTVKALQDIYAYVEIEGTQAKLHGFKVVYSPL